jgi:hypothetical protein
MTPEEVAKLAALLPVFRDVLETLEPENPWRDPCERFASNLNRTVAGFDRHLALPELDRRPPQPRGELDRA